MSNSWLCTRTKLLQICQIRSLTSFAWFQNRNNALSLDLGGNVANLHEDSCLMKSDIDPFSVPPLKFHYPFHERNSNNINLQCAEGNFEKTLGLHSISKYDILTYLKPLCSRNHDLLKSLVKIVEPANCNDTIHVGSSGITYSQNSLELKAVKRLHNHAFESFDAFSTVDQHVNNDFSNSLHKSVQHGSLKAEEKKWDAQMSNSTSNNKNEDSDDDRKGPSLEQLETVKEYYIEQLPKFRQVGEDFTTKLHHNHIVFENYFFKKPKVTEGLAKYSIQVSKFRILASFLYPRYDIEIQSIISHFNEGCVKMHFRVYLFSTLDLMRRYFKFLKDANPKSIDAISTFYVNKDGQITLHRLDRRIPVSELSKDPVTELAAKTAQMVGLAPKSPCNSTSKESVN